MNKGSETVPSTSFPVLTVRLLVMQRTVLRWPFCPYVRPSVKRVDYDKTEETLPTFLYQMKERLS